jgi:putative ABC transport system ATP-binding protein
MFIRLHNVVVAFGQENSIKALDNVSLIINQGEWMNILGPSGSGKTTLLNVIGGYQKIQNGKVEVDGKDLSQLQEEEIQTYRRNMISFIFQDYKLFDQFSVLENVMIPLLPYEKKEKIEQKAKEILEKLNMTKRMHAFPHQLSGGEKQRTAIARALLCDPKILLCDEPTGNLDSENRDHVMEILKQLHQLGMTILLVTHDTEVAKWGDRKVYIRDGKLKEEEALYERTPF